MRIEGKLIAGKLLEKLKDRVDALNERGVTPKLAVVLVGLDQASVNYVNQKMKIGEQLGASTKLLRYPQTVKQNGLEFAIQDLNSDTAVHGVIVQQPLPDHIDSAKIVNQIITEKDVDGFRLDTPFTPPIALAVLAILKNIHGEKLALETDFSLWLKGQAMCVVGRGPTGGKPIADYFKNKTSVTVVHSQTKNPDSHTQNADIVVTAVGKRGVLTHDMIKPGAILINVGMHSESTGMRGDYDEPDIRDKASYFTPTPGGVGPVNVACLWGNVVIAAEKSLKA